MTRSAGEFIGRATFEALTGRAVAHARVSRARAIRSAHISSWPRGPRLLCVAPATANFLAKAARGLADDLLSTLVLSFTGPMMLAPAMNCEMWEKPAVQRNVAQLRARRFVIRRPRRRLAELPRNGRGTHGRAGNDLRKAIARELGRSAPRKVKLPAATILVRWHRDGPHPDHFWPHAAVSRPGALSDQRLERPHGTGPGRGGPGAGHEVVDRQRAGRSRIPAGVPRSSVSFRPRTCSPNARQFSPSATG